MMEKRDPPPQAILSDTFKERMKGRRLLSGIFLTYQLQPGFFELEVLPVFLDLSLSHVSKIRHVQMEDSLRAMPGSLAVYYDADGLVPDENGSARLAVSRIPIRIDKGVFHPKNVILLVENAEEEEPGIRTQSLLVAALSANLTRSGWWENIECAHVVEIQEGESTRLKEDLDQFLKSLRDAAPKGIDQPAMKAIRGFLKRTEPRRKRFSQGELMAHFFAGGFRIAGKAVEKRSLAVFLDEIAGSEIRGMNLEILSPYFDDAGESESLTALIKRFEPKETRVLLPRDSSGMALCRKDLHQWVIDNGASWGHLAGDYTRFGKSQDAKPRFIHAKVYRFFSQSPKREITFLGSPNLTNAAHSGTMNVETGLLVYHEPSRRPEFWLTPDSRPPREFQEKQADENTGKSQGSRLNVRYDWNRSLAEASWEGKKRSPVLSLSCRGRLIGTLPELEDDTWIPMDLELSGRIREALAESSLFEVQGEYEEPTLLLVQEEGMAQKPSLLLTLSTADILKYWALLTPGQRNAYLEKHALNGDLTGLGADLVAKAAKLTETDGLFSRLAGIFHAFGCMERAIQKGLEAGSDKEAEYRLFGRKYDSLGTLLDKLDKPDEGGDAVERYVILQCAIQVAGEIKKANPDFWLNHIKDARDLELRFKQLNSLRTALLDTDQKDMGRFLDWFDKFFQERAKPIASESP